METSATSANTDNEVIKPASSPIAQGKKRTLKHPLVKVVIIGLIVNLIMIAIFSIPAQGASVKQPQPPSWVKQAIKDGKRCPQYEPLFKLYDLPVAYFTYISWRESRCQHGAVNAIWKNGKIVWTMNSDGSFDSGLFGINSTWKTVTSSVCRSPWGNMKVLFHAECNVKVAQYLYLNGGLEHWGFKSS